MNDNTLVLLKELIQPLVLHPESVLIYQKNLENGEYAIVIKVSTDDIRKVIGNGGRIFRSLRTLIRSSLRNYTLDVIVDVQ